METALSYFISIGLWLDKIIYSGIGLVYELLMEIADFEIFSQGTIEEFSKRIYALLGIFMLFKLTFSLITYVVNPDEMADKTKGMASIGKNVIISLVMILLTPYIFAEAYNLQKIILNEHTLENLVFGTQSSSANSTSRAGEILQFNLFSQFVRPNVEEIPDLKSCDIMYELDEDGNYKKEQFEGTDSVNHYVVNEACFSSLEGLFDETTYFLNYKQAFVEQKYGLLVNIPEVYKATHKIDNVEYPILNYQFLLSTVVGFAVLIVLLNFCLDIATRSIKLAFYQIISPIPIISMCDPKSSKSGMFSKWVKACFNTYLSLFIRLLALYLAIYIITAVVQDATFDGIASVFIIIGALIFAKELPKIITDLTGIKLDGKFTLNPFKKIQDEAIGGKRLGGAVGGFVAGFVGGRGIGSALTGFARGFGDGKGYESGLAKQADVNRKLREARINGYTGIKARIAASASRYGLDDAMLEADATKMRRNKDAIDLKRKSIDSDNKNIEIKKKAVEKSIAPLSGVIKQQEKVKSSIGKMEDKATELIKKGKAGTISDRYKSLQGYNSAMEGAKPGDILSFDVEYAGRKVYTAGTKLDSFMIGDIKNMAEKFAGKEGKEAIMNELMSSSGTTATTHVDLDEVKNFKTLQNTYKTDVKNANSVIAEYMADPTTTISVNPLDDSNLDIYTSKSSPGIGAKAQSNDITNLVESENSSISSEKIEIEKYERQIKANIADAEVVYDGVKMSLEEAERRLKAEQERIDRLKQQSKINRDAAAAAKINWNDK